MFGTVGIEGLKIECIIGDLPDERAATQEVTVSVFGTAPHRV